MMIHGRNIQGVRFRTPTSRGWTEKAANNRRIMPNRLARNVLYVAVGSR